jgi:hypothetical protein
MSYEIFDNFLGKKDFAELEEVMMGEEFPWYYKPSKVLKDDAELKNHTGDLKHNFQFLHMFYTNSVPTSNFFTILGPLLNKIDPFALLRVKANLITRTENQVVHGFHLDHPNFDGKIYLNFGFLHFVLSIAD